MVSVIIPVYNTEKYLSYCLDSVINQTYRNLQIIVVDDGSVDNSVEVIQSYVNTDSRIQLLKKKNGGQSSARNLGLRNALGKYIVFLDSDDILDLSAIQILYSEAESKKTDIVYFDADVFFDDPKDFDKNKVSYYQRSSSYGCNTGKQMLCEMLGNNNFTDSACLMLYRKEFLDSSNLTFFEGMYYEDCLFSITAMLKAKYVSHINKKLYLYRVHENSTMTRVPKAAEYLYGRCVCMHKFFCMLHMENFDDFQFMQFSNFVLRIQTTIKYLASIMEINEINRFFSFQETSRLLYILKLCDCYEIVYINKLASFFNKNDKCYIWGCGIYARRLFAFLRLQNLDSKILGFIDSNKKNELFFNKSVYKTKIVDETNDGIIICFNSPEAAEIEKKLILKGKNVLRINPEFNDFICKELKKELKLL